MGAFVTVDRVIRRDQIIVVVSVVLVLLLSCSVLVQWGAIVTPHTIASGAKILALVSLMWVVMMTAMMLPAVIPWMLAYAAITRTSGGSGQLVSIVLFGAGYFVVWTAFSLAAASVQLVLQQRALLETIQVGRGSTVGGALLVVAGVYQFSRLKAACLKHCRTPLSFFLSRWRDGPMGGFEMGVRHGVFCLGCCWALMLLAFALGVMNLLWMAILTLVICVENLAPGGAALGRMLGVVLVAWGVWLI